MLKDIKRTLEYDAGYLFDYDLHEEFEDNISTGLSIIYKLLVEAPEPAARTDRLLQAHALAESIVDAIREGLESEANGERRAERASVSRLTFGLESSDASLCVSMQRVLPGI